jgi:hypothetical protein
LPGHTDSSGALQHVESRVQHTQRGERGVELRRRALGLPISVLLQPEDRFQPSTRGLSADGGSMPGSAGPPQN